jgi:hypothetical protein
VNKSEDKMATKTTEVADAPSTEMTQPIIIDLGSQKSSNLKELKKGKGKLWEEVLNVVEETKEMLGDEAKGKVIMPVIMIYQKKSRRQSLEKLIFPYLK